MIARYAAFCAALVLALAGSRAMAETIAERVFGKWEPITIDQIKKAVPEVLPDPKAGGYGAVQPRQWIKPDTLPDHCYLLENGKRVGARLSC